MEGIFFGDVVAGTPVTADVGWPAGAPMRAYGPVVFCGPLFGDLKLSAFGDGGGLEKFRM